MRKILNCLMLFAMFITYETPIAMNAQELKSKNEERVKQEQTKEEASSTEEKNSTSKTGGAKESEKNPKSPVIDMPDEHLRNYINLEIGQSLGNQIRQNDLDKLTTIAGGGNADKNSELKQVTDLKGLEYAHNLTLVNIDDSKIKDITPLINCSITGLRLNSSASEGVRIDETNITPDTPLFKHLKSLQLYTNRFVIDSPKNQMGDGNNVQIIDMPYLTHLELHVPEISTNYYMSSVVFNVDKLKEFDLTGVNEINQYQNDGVTLVGETHQELIAPNLERFQYNLGSAKGVTVDPLILKTTSKLNVFFFCQSHLSSKQLEKIVSYLKVANSPDLRHIYLASNDLETANLEGLNYLVDVSIEDNLLVKLDVASDALENLYVDRTKLTELPSPEKNNHLNKISAIDTPIKSIEPYRDVENFTYDGYNTKYLPEDTIKTKEIEKLKMENLLDFKYTGNSKTIYAPLNDSDEVRIPTSSLYETLKNIFFSTTPEGFEGYAYSRMVNFSIGNKSDTGYEEIASTKSGVSNSKFKQDGNDTVLLDATGFNKLMYGYDYKFDNVKKKLSEKVYGNIILSHPELTGSVTGATSGKDHRLTGKELISLFGITGTDEADGKVSSSQIKVDQSAVKYNEEGVYPVKFTATDSVGGTSTLTTQLTIAEERPKIETNTDKATINAEDSSFNYIKLFGVKATDVDGRDITKKVKVDSSAVDLTANGKEFPVYFSVEGRTGTTEIKNVTVKVINDTPPKITFDSKELSSNEGTVLKDEDIKTKTGVKRLTSKMVI